jgi:5-methylcytosine-specific restriction endonuclease McrA
MRQAFVAGRSCAYCGQPADHVNPVSRGGSDSPTNLQALCSSCNLTKSDD